MQLISLAWRRMPGDELRARSGTAGTPRRPRRTRCGRPRRGDTWVCIPEPGWVVKGLGMKRRPDALAQRHLPHHGAEGHDVVGGATARRRSAGRSPAGPGPPSWWLNSTEMPIASSIDDRLAAEVRAPRLGGVVEVAAAVHRDRVRAGRRGVLEEVELDLGVGVEGEPLVGGRREGALEDVPRVGVRRAAVGHHDVAEHPRRRRALAAATAGSGTSTGRAWRACRPRRPGRSPRSPSRRSRCPRRRRSPARPARPTRT